MESSFSEHPAALNGCGKIKKKTTDYIIHYNYYSNLTAYNLLPVSGETNALITSYKLQFVTVMLEHISC
jgi:hypothetical protein